MSGVVVVVEPVSVLVVVEPGAVVVVVVGRAAAPEAFIAADVGGRATGATGWAAR
jgi:hypothetical protein